MTQRVQMRHSDTPGDAPLELLAGEMAVNLPDRQLWVGAMDGSVIPLFSADIFGSYLPLTGGQINGDLAVTGSITTGGVAVATVAQLSGYLPLTGGVLSGKLTINAASPVGGIALDVEGGTISSSSAITTTSTMLCGHLAAGTDQGASGNGGAVGTWQVANNLYRGFVSDSAGRLVFGSGDAGIGSISSSWFYHDGANFALPFGTGYKPGGGPWADSSDARIKTELRAYEHGLDQIMALRPVVYRFKGNDGAPHVEGQANTEPGHDETTHIGLIAQEVEVVMPEMVTMRDGWIDGQPVDDLRVLDTNALLFAAVNAIKQLKAEIDQLWAEMPGKPLEGVRG